MAQLALQEVHPRFRRDELAQEYGPFIRRIAFRLARRLPPQVQVDDLISAGYEGLLDAIEKFDPRRVERLDQYAEYRVRGAMLDALRALDPLGRDKRSRSRQLREAVRVLSMRLGRAPEEQEIAAEMKMDLGDYRHFLEELSRSTVLSLEDFGVDHGQLPADVNAVDPSEAAEFAELRERLAGALERIPERQRLVLTLYYYEDLNLREIGEILDVTESRVCQIHTEAVHRLRATLDPISDDL